MVSRKDLMYWIAEALEEEGGPAKVVDVAKRIWGRHKDDLKRSGDMFYTWQYDMRWAAKQLRDKGIIAEVGAVPRGTWALKR